MALNPTPGLPEFEYIKLASLGEASAFLAKHAGEARPFMGGTDTFVRLRDKAWHEKYLVDVKSFAGMNDISFNPQTGLTIGAAVNMNRIIHHSAVQKHYPLLAEAAISVASYQLRNRATIVGNICNASPAGDTLGASILLKGILSVHGVNGVREESLERFFHAPGKTNLKFGDIATTVHYPLPPKGAVGKYIKLNRNNNGDLAIVSVTALGYPDAETLSGFRIKLILGSVGPVPLTAPAAEAILTDAPITADSIAQAAQAAMDASTPIDDTRGTAAYRKQMVKNLTKRAVETVWEKLI